MMTFRSILIAFALAACSGAAAATLPPDAVILPGRQGAVLLDQCSRSTPDAGEGSWTPAPADIAALESALPGALQTQEAGRGLGRAPDGWRRQYVGLVRGGRRYVYGSFFPADMARHEQDPDRWRREPVIVCDGGPDFFGVEYEVEAGRFTHFGFNGSA
ncbi:hypothetical protein [Sphingosinicella terrae]|uniref:hypothetical protein n=1 Tax=Sphingosinicella terrae TaxID=2172047 RepID=UPI000E0CFAEF|nr:hypothetical protein [Sphingosinicella terrae]